MRNLLNKVFILLKSNKKKAFTGLIFADLLVLWRKREKVLNYDTILNKFQQKIMRQLELNFKQQQKLAERLHQIEAIKSNFYNNLPNLKAKEAHQISQMFLITDIKEDLKKKDLKPAEKQQLWDRFKDENLLFSVMILTIFPLMSMIKVLKEMVFGKFVNQQDLPIKSQDYIRIIEKILDNFIEHMIEIGVNETFFFLNKVLKADFGGLKVSSDLTFQDLFDIFSGFESRVLVFVEKSREIPQKKLIKINEKGIYWKNGISEKVSGVDYDEIGNYLIGKSKNMTQKSLNFRSFFKLNTDQKLSIPSVLLNILEEFLGKIKSHGMLNDHKFILSVVNNLKTLENQENVLEGLEKSPEIVDEKLIIEKAREEKPENEEHIVTEAIMGLCNELIDWLESKNFQVLYYHSIRLSFFKLKTRLMLHKQKTKGEKMKLANFLTLIYRIMNEEFLSANSEEINEGFYKSRVKNNLANVFNHNQNEAENIEEMKMNVRILEEYEMNLRMKESLTEVLKRIYLEELFEENEVPAPNNEKNVEGKEFNDIMTLLKGLG